MYMMAYHENRDSKLPHIGVLKIVMAMCTSVCTDMHIAMRVHMKTVLMHANHRMHVKKDNKSLLPKICI